MYICTEDIVIYMAYYRLCRAIALAAKAVKLTYDHQTTTKSTCTVLKAVSDALKYVSDKAHDQSSGSLDGFLQLTDSIIYAIKIADPQDLQFRTDITDKDKVLKDLNAVNIQWHNVLMLLSLHSY